MKRDFPFTLALAAAVTLHLLLGVFLRKSVLVGAAPLSQPLSPVTMRFVEVPPDATTVPEAPDARYLSDANRKAGPQIPPPPKAPGPEVASRLGSTPAEPPGGPGSATAARPTQKLDSNDPIRNETTTEQGTIPLSDSSRSAGDRQSGEADGRLANSLGNLDRFIGSGSGQSSSGQVPVDPGSGVFFDTQGFDLGPWANRVIAMVRSNWLVPVTADLGIKGVVSVSFQVSRSGSILNPRILSSSQIPSYDQAALNALTASNPFPALPADFPRDFLPAVFRFYYNTPVPE